jgi:hypothetical protein
MLRNHKEENGDAKKKKKKEKPIRVINIVNVKNPINEESNNDLPHNSFISIKEERRQELIPQVEEELSNMRKSQLREIKARYTRKELQLV